MADRRASGRWRGRGDLGRDVVLLADLRGEGGGGEPAQLVEHPVAGERDDDQRRGELGHEGQDAVLELGRGLDHGDGETDDEAGDQKRRGHHDDDAQRAAPQVEQRIGGHDIAPRSSDWTTRCQPSIITNTSSLIGSATTCGGTITMPSAVKIVAATRSITRNGNRIVRPILNESRSSDSTNAGIAILSGTSSIVSGRGALDTS